MLSFLFLQSELPQRGIQESRRFCLIKTVKKYFEKKLKNILSVQKKFLLLHSQTKTEQF